MYIQRKTRQITFIISFILHLRSRNFTTTDKYFNLWLKGATLCRYCVHICWVKLNFIIKCTRSRITIGLCRLSINGDKHIRNFMQGCCSQASPSNEANHNNKIFNPSQTVPLLISRLFPRFRCRWMEWHCT